MCLKANSTGRIRLCRSTGRRRMMSIIGVDLLSTDKLHLSLVRYAHQRGWLHVSARRRLRTRLWRENYQHDVDAVAPATDTVTSHRLTLHLSRPHNWGKTRTRIKHKLIRLAGNLLSGFCLIGHFCDIVEMFWPSVLSHNYCDKIKMRQKIVLS